MFGTNWSDTKAFIYRGKRFGAVEEGGMGHLHPVIEFDRISLDSLFGIEEQKRELLKNVESFLVGKGGINTLLYGARGCGKSSLSKAIFTKYLFEMESDLRVIEIDREDLCILPILIDIIRELPYRFIIFCDDISFEKGDGSYRFLKSVLEGSIEKVASNVIFFATSNRRHIVAESFDAQDGQPDDTIEESISLSDRFGLRIGFYKMGMDEYLEIVKKMVGSESEFERVKMEAINYAGMVGNRSGRSANEFFKLYRSGLISPKI